MQKADGSACLLLQTKQVSLLPVDAGSSVSDIDGIEFCFMSDFLFVCSSDAVDECIYCIIF